MLCELKRHFRKDFTKTGEKAKCIIWLPGTDNRMMNKSLALLVGALTLSSLLSFIPHSYSVIRINRRNLHKLNVQSFFYKFCCIVWMSRETAEWK